MKNRIMPSTHLDTDENQGEEVLETHLATQNNNAKYSSKIIQNEITFIIKKQIKQMIMSERLKVVVFKCADEAYYI